MNKIDKIFEELEEGFLGSVGDKLSQYNNAKYENDYKKYIAILIPKIEKAIKKTTRQEGITELQNYITQVKDLEERLADEKIDKKGFMRAFEIMMEDKKFRDIVNPNYKPAKFYKKVLGGVGNLTRAVVSTSRKSTPNVKREENETR